MRRMSWPRPSQAATQPRWLPLLLWLAVLATCVLVVVRSHYTADLSAFLPSNPTAEQKVLIDQLRDGPASRLILAGIELPKGEAVSPSERGLRLARLSKALSLALRQPDSATSSPRASSPFASISNGEPLTAARDQAILLRYRYLLSQQVTPARFQTDGLHTALLDSIDLMGSSAGLVLGPLLTRDPSAEMLHLIEQFDTAGERHMVDGVWLARDGQRALMLAQTVADGADLDAQQTAIDTLRATFARTKAALNEADAQLILTGPGVFATQSRHTIESEATRLSTLGSLIIVTLLLSIYRSLTALLLGLLPMVTGALAGIAGVSLVYGTVHGITLGFGITLIGEAVDYAIYLFVQRGSEPRDASRPRDVPGFWSTIILGVLTSIIGFSSLLASGFQGLAQLGLFSIVGIVTAALVTRWVLPELMPRRLHIPATPRLNARLAALAAQAPRLRGLVALGLAGAVAVLYLHRDHLWSRELSSLSPVSVADQNEDMRMRAELGAPDVRFLVVARGADSEAALQAAERLNLALNPLVEQGMLLGIETPSRYLPSAASQGARQAALPDDAALRATFAQAAKDTPLVASRFEPFFSDVAQARTLKPLTRADLQGSSLTLGVDAMLVPQQGRWTALLALRVPATDTAQQPLDTHRIRAAIAQTGLSEVHFIDLKIESEALYSDYLGEALSLSLWGALAVIVLLTLVLRSARKLAQVVAPLLGAVLIVAAMLVACGPPLTLFHLVGLLLIVAVGSNYALFFVQQVEPASKEAAKGSKGKDDSVLSSMLFANLTTVAGFGMLAWSQVPVLHAFGATVAPGAMLALLLAAILRPKAS
jgi:predicted exporter